MPAEKSFTDSITRVDLAELIALRARAGKPGSVRTHARTPLAGGHVSALRGRGMDYAESRVYQAGDDARNIDWRRTARSGKWHTKLFEAERERSLLLLMDTHATMRFGTRVRYKSVAAARAAAWLAWTCVRGGDRVGALAFGAVRDAVDPHAGTRGALNTLGAVARWDAAAGAGAEAAEPLSTAIARAQRLIAAGNRVWLLSDGWCTDANATAALVRLTRHAEVRVVIIVDPLERELAPRGAYVFETAADRQLVDLGGAEARAGFRDALAAGWHGLASACDAAGVAWMMLSTGDEPDVALAPFLRRRSARHE
ncbi:MAG TPA: DUF58 domain-containing protein [Rhodanobacteraceae bacterium]|nr:DUF58 domain-containing protein [Rhodanobacteraceae bacterium]